MQRAAAFAAPAPPHSVIRDGMIHAGKTMKPSASCDRRMIDGVAAARFIARLVELIEKPGELLGP
ncbi:MAG: 2-oxo acid dehydrogenase subunit E2 [Planctomycetota bacterium]